ncbi:MAG: amidohydrolase [Fimbriimonadaceae bacterium]|nr:amidohydrolase [Fimbriimonadaceae bacterium]
MLAFALMLLTQTAEADLAVINAKVWTDGSLQTADCIGSKNGRIIFVGKRSNLILAEGAKTVDAKGAVVIPGLIDSHAHLMEGGIRLSEQLNLRGAKSKEDFIRLVREFNAKLPAGKWLLGYAWSAESWPGAPQPTKDWIDSFTGDRPVVLRRMDGHSLVANSAALKLAKIDKDGPADPPGGVIDRDPVTKEPTGMLRETAMGLIKMPNTTLEDQYQGFLAAVKEANRYGVTAVSDISSPGNVGLYQRYYKTAEPSLRVGFYSRTDWGQAFATLKNTPRIPGWFFPNGVKAYMDGSLGSRTAFMHNPFTKPLENQAQDWRGVPMPGAVDGTYAKRFVEAGELGHQVIVHAIGDQANHDVLDLFSKVPKLNGKRFRIEHAQHLLPADIPRFGQLGVIASMQPYHKADDGRYCDDIIGHERSESSYAYRSLLKSGARLAFGSDWPVVTIDPWAGIDAAVRSVILTGKVWVPEQAITIDEALDAYTRGGAYAMYMENEVGRLAIGYHTDFVVLNKSPFEKGVDFRTVKPKAVYVAGRLVFGG